MRYSLRTLMIGLAWIGPVCLALRTPTIFWSLAVFVSVVVALLTSVLVIAYRTGRTRAFAIGFLLFAGSFFVLLLLPTGGQLRTAIMVSHMATMLYQQVHGQVIDSHRLMAFSDVVHCVLVILLGLAGGAIAQVLCAGQRQDA